jgi:hypothetical protein
MKAESWHISTVGTTRSWQRAWNQIRATCGYTKALLIEDWGTVIRRLREIPTIVRYRREGEYSPDVLKRRFGAWVKLPEIFRDFAKDKPEWSDVLALLPPPVPQSQISIANAATDGEVVDTQGSQPRHAKLTDRPTYGNPINFRGLRHEPVNEQGVVFLFGMIANELDYMVEVVQTGYPDCEAKRQLAPNKWQRVRIEFEFESRNFATTDIHMTDAM